MITENKFLLKELCADQKSLVEGVDWTVSKIDDTPNDALVVFLILH